MSFIPEDSHSLRDISLETRDALPTLAVQIVAAKYNLASTDADTLVTELHDVIEELHYAYQQKHY